MYREVKKHHMNKVRGSNKWAKICFQCIQVDYSKDEPIVRTGEEQTNLLIKGGYDAVLDESRSINTAVINDREPNQIIFLKRSAFKVVEVFNLRGGDDKFIVTSDPTDNLSRKWSALLLNVIGDKIKEVGVKDWNGSRFNTVKGREILIDFYHTDDSYRDGLKIGQKAHKKHKLYDDYSAKVNIKTEYGNLMVRLHEDENFEDIKNKLKEEWSRISSGEIIEDWKPISNASIEADEKKEREDRWAKEKTEKLTNNKARYSKWIENMMYLAELFNIPFKDLGQEKMLKYLEEEESVYNRLPWTLSMNDANERIDELIGTYSDIKNEFPDDPRWFLKHNFGDDSDETLENVKNYYEIVKYIFFVQTKISNNFYTIMNDPKKYENDIKSIISSYSHQLNIL
jgi:hypothetical protein